MTEFFNSTQQPGVASTPPPVPASSSRRRGGRGVAGLVLAAGLIGGGVGAGITHGMTAANGTTISADLAGDGRSNPASPAGSVQAVAQKVLPSVVTINVRGNPPSSAQDEPFGLLPFPFGGEPGAQQGNGGPAPDSATGEQLIGSGSGIVISKDGLILTNNHVAGAGDLSVTFKDGRTVPAKLVKDDELTDLAVIKADGITDAIPINFGRSVDLKVGQPVVALGAPLGLNGTVTSGIISALHRPVDTTGHAQRSGTAASKVPQAHVTDAIQTDAPINPGNSGGALVDMNGDLVGITSAIASLGASSGGQSGSIGLGFAIPVDQARPIADTLAAGRTVKHALLSVELRDYNTPTQTGAQLGPVVGGGPAATGGLQEGDVVTKVDTRLIDSADALVAAVRSHNPGDRITITLLRNGRSQTQTITLGDDSTGDNNT
jgi:putative serine protease PepD